MPIAVVMKVEVTEDLVGKITVEKVVDWKVVNWVLTVITDSGQRLEFSGVEEVEEEPEV